MFKFINFLVIQAFMPVFSFAQQDQQLSILSDAGIHTVSQTDEGNDMILFDVVEWNRMAEGTKYSSDNLSGIACTDIFIQIAGKHSGLCRSGIGFGCGIFDRKEQGSKVKVVNDKNRFCAATLQMTDAHTVKIIFLDKVDWDSLHSNL